MKLADIPNATVQNQIESLAKLEQAILCLGNGIWFNDEKLDKKKVKLWNELVDLKSAARKKLSDLEWAKIQATTSSMVLTGGSK